MNAYPRMRSPGWKTQATSADGHKMQVQRFRVEVIDGPNSGQSAQADGTELSVGTAEGNDLIVTDPTVSRHHLSIVATADGFRIRDLDSTNGTRLAGYEIESAFLDSGALIQLGETTMRFEVLDEQTSHLLSQTDNFGGVLGTSVAMRHVFGLLERVADTDSTILLGGETGTGKGALAEAIHAQSRRKGRPFVVVDCGAIPHNLIESELFGHERGSFTGADERRIGAFEAADGGTVFLDEIGELPADMQPKLLRVLESRQVRRVGSVTPIPIDVRIVAATNRDLRKEVNAGQFRADLYYRLNVLRVTVPPLRERREDIPQLVGHFYQRLTQCGEAPPAELITRLLRQRWSGNVRELKSAVERAVLLGQAAADDSMAPRGGGDEHSWPELDFGCSFREAKEAAVAAWTAVYVRELLDRFGGNLSRAARTVSMDRNHLRDLLHKYASPKSDADR